MSKTKKLQLHYTFVFSNTSLANCLHSMDYQEKNSINDNPFPQAIMEYAEPEPLNKTYQFENKERGILHLVNNETSIPNNQQVNFIGFYLNENKIGYFYSNHNDADSFGPFIDFSGNFLPEQKLLLPQPLFKKIKEQELKVFIKP